MEELRLRWYVRVLFVAAFVVFVVNKLVVRPLLGSQVLPEPLMVLTYSVPNFCEAVMGLTIVSGLLLWARLRGFAVLRALGKTSIQWLAIAVASIYVLTQEVGLHSLGGNNVYDPNDIVASLLGLALTAALFLRYGVLDDGVGSHARDQTTR